MQELNISGSRKNYGPVLKKDDPLIASTWVGNVEKSLSEDEEKDVSLVELLLDLVRRLSSMVLHGTR